MKTNPFVCMNDYHHDGCIYSVVVLYVCVYERMMVSVYDVSVYERMSVCIVCRCVVCASQPDPRPD